MAKLTGEEHRRIQPRLRMIRNGDTLVNALRSEHSPSVAVSEAVTKKLGIQEMRGDGSAPVSKEDVRKEEVGKPGVGKPSDSTVSVFIDSQSPKCAILDADYVQFVPAVSIFGKCANAPISSHQFTNTSITQTSLSASHLRAFLDSSLAMLSMVGLAAVGLYPRLVPSSTDLAYSLTIPLRNRNTQ